MRLQNILKYCEIWSNISTFVTWTHQFQHNHSVWLVLNKCRGEVVWWANFLSLFLLLFYQNFENKQNEIRFDEILHRNLTHKITVHLNQFLGIANTSIPFENCVFFCLWFKCNETRLKSVAMLVDFVDLFRFACKSVSRF